METNSIFALFLTVRLCQLSVPVMLLSVAMAGVFLYLEYFI